MRFLPRAKAAKGWMTHESASALASPVSSHASGYRKNNRKSQEIFQMSIVAPVISPIAATAASAPRTPRARRVPLATQKVTRGPVMHRRLVVAPRARPADQVRDIRNPAGHVEHLPHERPEQVDRHALRRVAQAVEVRDGNAQGRAVRGGHVRHQRHRGGRNDEPRPACKSSE